MGERHQWIEIRPLRNYTNNLYKLPSTDIISGWTNAPENREWRAN